MDSVDNKGFVGEGIALCPSFFSVFVDDLLKGVNHIGKVVPANLIGTQFEILGEPPLDTMDISFFEFLIKEIPAFLGGLGDLIERRGFKEHQVMIVGFLSHLDKPEFFYFFREPAGIGNFFLPVFGTLHNLGE